jgi:hypothetical protein
MAWEIFVITIITEAFDLVVHPFHPWAIFGFLMRRRE